VALLRAGMKQDWARGRSVRRVAAPSCGRCTYCGKLNKISAFHSNQNTMSMICLNGSEDDLQRKLYLSRQIIRYDLPQQPVHLLAGLVELVVIANCPTSSVPTSKVGEINRTEAACTDIRQDISYLVFVKTEVFVAGCPRTG
jgi:hypothetical protein